MATSGGRSTGWRRRTVSAPRAWRAAPGSIPPPSTRASAHPRGQAALADHREHRQDPDGHRREHDGVRRADVGPRCRARPPPPLIGYAQAGAAGYFDDAGYPVGRGWEDIDFPDLRDPAAYALEVAGDSMMPVYRSGDVIVVSPAADIRRGDRVVVKTRKGEVMAKQLLRQTAQKIELGSLNPRHPTRSLEMSEVRWIARILWVSQ
jgi:Predicted transcriptional regulator